MMAEEAFRWVSQFKGGAERSFSIFHAGAIRLVNDQHVRDFENAGFDRLDLISQARCFHHDRGMREPRHIHFTLSRTDCFDDNDLIPGGIKNLHYRCSFLRDASQRTARSHRTDSDIWIPSIVKTVATEGKGIDELIESIAKHEAHQHRSGNRAARDRARLESELETLLQEALMDRFRENIPQENYDEILGNVVNRNLSPYEAVKLLVNGNTN